jgi:hypothetical protein
MSQINGGIPSSGPGSGTVTSISAGEGITLTPNPIVATGTVALTIPVVIADGGTNATSMTNTDGVVYFDGTKLNTTTVGTSTYVLTSNGAGMAPTFQAPGGVTSITGGANISITGTASIPIVNVAGTTNHSVLVGTGATGMTSLTAGTTGQVLTGVTGSDPVFASPAASSISITGNTGGVLTGSAFTFTAGTTGLSFGGSGTTETLSGTLVVANGGTGRTTLTAHGVLLGNGTTAITQLAAAATGATLMGSTGADPAFTGSPSFSGSVTAGTTVTATSGAITATSGNMTMTAASTSSVSNLVINGVKVLHTYGTNNFFAGNNPGNYTLTGNENTGIGYAVGSALTSGSSNCLFGLETADSMNQGNYNCAYGQQCMNAVTTGSNNVAIGFQALVNAVTGTGNISIGYQAGAGSTTSDSYNICIGQGTSSANGVSNALVIGAGNGTGAGQLSSATICGITGVTVTGTAVLCSTAGVLGTVASSRKYKDDIKDMDDSQVIHNLRPVTFTMKNDSTKHRQWGLIAEEVQEIYPDLVNYHHETGDVDSVRYLDLIPMLVKEVQLLRTELNNLKGK